MFKKVMLTLSVLTAGFSSFSQSCCEMVFASNDGNMSAFVADANFRNMHPSPLPYVHISEFGGEMIQINTSGEKANAYLIKSRVKSDKWLFVYQEWWGLNDHIKKTGRSVLQGPGTIC